MKKKSNLYLGLLFMFLCCFLLVGCQKEKENVDGYRSIKIIEIKGDVKVTRSKVGEVSAYIDMKLQDNDIVEVSENGYLRILLDDDKYIYVEKNSYFTIEASGNSKDSKTNIHLEKGAILTEIQNDLSPDSSYDITTPNSTMSVRGTVYYVEVIEDNNNQIFTKLHVFKGTVGSKLIYPDQTISEEEIRVEMGYGVLVRKDTQISEYVLFNNNALKKIEINEIKLETLQNLLKVTEIDTLIYNSQIIEEEIRLRQQDGNKQDNQNTQNQATSEDKSYSIYLYDGSDSTKRLRVKAGSSVNLPTPMKYGYQFGGWYTSLDSHQRYDNNYVPTQDITLYAKWIQLNGSLYFNNGYMSYDSVKGPVGSSLTLPIPQRQGYTFMGWYKDIQFEERVNKLTFENQNQVLYAKWKANTYHVEVHNTSLAQTKYTFDFDTLVDLPIPTKEGYTFKGWYLDNQFKKPLGKFMMSDYKLDVYAKWIPNSVTITYNEDVDVVKKVQATVGEKLDLIIPTKEGYIFDGWFLDQEYKNKVINEYVPTHNMVLYAKWKERNDIQYIVNTYILKSSLNQYEKLKTETYHNGSPQMIVSIDQQIENQGMTYLLRSDIKNQVFKVNNDGSSIINLYYVHISIDYYLIHFEKFDGTKSVKTLRRDSGGETIQPWPTSSSIDGYTFKEWNTKKDGSGTTIDDTKIFTPNDENMTIYEIQVDYVPYTVTFEMQTLDHNTLDYYQVAKMSMMGRPNTIPALEKLVLDKSAIPINYELEYPTASQIDINGTSNYIVKIRYTGQLSQISFQFANQEIITRYYKVGEKFIGLESSLLNDLHPDYALSGYGYYYLNNNKVEYLTPITKEMNGKTFVYQAMEEDAISHLYTINLTIRYGDTSPFVNKYLYKYLSESNDIVYTGPIDFGYSQFAVNSQKEDHLIKTYASNIMLTHTLYYDYNLPKDAQYEQLPLTETVYQKYSKILVDPSQYVSSHDYEFKGWRITNKNGQNVDDCFVEEYSGFLGNVYLKAEWKEK